MIRSEQIGEIAAALALAQGEIAGAVKGSENPHFRSKYADLAATWDACRGPLSKYGIGVAQFPRLISFGDAAWAIELDTFLLHKSGEYMGDTLAIPIARADAQAIGSAITYARRYALAAVAGVAPEEDDGEAAVAGSRPEPGRKPPPPEPVTVTGKIAAITQRPSGTTGTRYTVALANGEKYGTLQKGYAEIAKGAHESGGEVEIQYRQFNYGNDIIAIRDLTLGDPLL